MSPSTPNRLRDKVTDRLREEILTGKLEEGEALREIPLAARFKVSRGPIRDALLQLTQEGLLVTEANRGSRVNQVWDKNVRPKMVTFRCEIECFALRHLLHRGPDMDLSIFRDNLAKFEVACRKNRLDAVVRLDMAFHRAILEESLQPGLESVWRPIMGGMRLPYSRHRTLLDSYHEHKEIVAAMEAGKIRPALAALKNNIH